MTPQSSLQEYLGDGGGSAGLGMENSGLGLISLLGTAKSAGLLFLGGKMSLGS